MSPAPDDLMARLPREIAARIALRLPDLRACRAMAGRFDLGQLKRRSVSAPAVLVSWLGGREAPALAGEVRIWRLSMTAFIVTRDRPGLSRDQAAASIAQVLMGLIPGQTWGLVHLGQAEDARLDVLVSAGSEAQAVNLSAVSWTQPMTLGGPAPEGPIDPAVYVGQAPAIGADHAGDYEQIGGGT